MKENRIYYDCDTYDYWCSEDDYSGESKKEYGRFAPDGKSYEIFTKDTPRPWLNYLCNDKIASAVSNTGLGFFWYKTSLLRVTKYEHIIDYQPRTFEDGRDVYITDLERGESFCVFRDAENVTCVHRPGKSVISAEIKGFSVNMTIFVPTKDSGECWRVEVKSQTKRNIKIAFRQVWSVARFGIHTAEEGIPYLSVPGKDQSVAKTENTIKLHTSNSELPTKLWCAFISPECDNADFCNLEDVRKDGRVFNFVRCELSKCVEVDENGAEFNIISLAEADETLFNDLCTRYLRTEEFLLQEQAVDKMWGELLQYPSCTVPDKNVQNFLNTWLKNQIFLTFRYIRSGYIGYRDTIQDSWGYTLIEPKRAREQILKTLSFMNSDGTCPRNFSPFGKQDKHDMRNTMDSATWIGMCIHDYIAETGDYAILEEKISYLDTDKEETVYKHITKAMDALYEMRGMYGFCLVKDGDWNDAIEGISKSGDAVSIWLTMAFYHAQNMLSEVFARSGHKDIADTYTQRNKELYKIINEHGWDGEWYRYAICGNGNFVGSDENEEGKIHLNANTWAVFTGLADEERTEKVFNSIDKHLATFVGPALLAPPYRKKPCEAGRVVNLEPGTFENGSVYQHAVCFYIYALLKAGKVNEAFDAFTRVLPTNPENFDSRRTSEPYCTGNYYCGPSHERAGQNFFTWFTGNPAWLLRAGFDEMLGVKATLDGLLINPNVPDSWDSFEVKRIFRGVKYTVKFQKGTEKKILVNGKEYNSNVLNVTDTDEAVIEVVY